MLNQNETTANPPVIPPPIPRKKILPPPLPKQIIVPLPLPEKDWWIGADGKQEGPFKTTRIMELISLGEISRETLVWAKGMVNWTPISDLVEFSNKAKTHTDKAVRPSFANINEFSNKSATGVNQKVFPNFMDNEGIIFENIKIMYGNILHYEIKVDNNDNIKLNIYLRDVDKYIHNSKGIDKLWARLNNTFDGTPIAIDITKLKITPIELTEMLNKYINPNPNYLIQMPTMIKKNAAFTFQRIHSKIKWKQYKRNAIVIVCIIVVAFMIERNPSEQAHLYKLSERVESNIQNLKNKSRDTSILNSIAISMAEGGLWKSMVKYNNYILFSTLTMHGETLTFGVFVPFSGQFIITLP